MSEEHWKVGDGMFKKKEPFMIGQIAIVVPHPERERDIEIRYYDVHGEVKGCQKARVIS